MSKTGRFYFTVGTRTFCVEPIDNNLGKQKIWGDIDPATKTVTGSYGTKDRGSIHASESIINEANGFKNIAFLPGGTSPMSYIEEMIKSGKW